MFEESKKNKFVELLKERYRVKVCKDYIRIYSNKRKLDFMDYYLHNKSLKKMTLGKVQTTHISPKDLLTKLLK